MKVDLLVNGARRNAEVEARTTLVDCLRDNLGLTGVHTGCEHGICGACTVLIDGEPARSCLMFAVQADGYQITTIEALAPAPGELSVIQDAFCETHGMQCGFCTSGMILTAHALLARNPEPTRADIVEAISANICRCTGYGQIVEAIGLRRAASPDRTSRTRAGEMTAAEFKFVSANRRVREDRRFVVGRGKLCRRHQARRHAACRDRRLAAPGRAYRFDRCRGRARDARRASCVDRRGIGGGGRSDAQRPRYAAGAALFARGRAGALSGEWVAAVVAETRAMAEDAAELVEVEYEPLPHVIDVEEALDPASPPVHPEHGSNVLLDKTFVWGEVERHFAESPRQLSFRVTWGRNSTVPIETFGVLARGIRGTRCWTSGPRSRCRNMPSRSPARCGCRPTRCACITTSMSAELRREARHQAYRAGRHLARKLGRPVRLIEDRLDNMRSGDTHGPERIFDVAVAFDDDGIVKSMKMRALDNVGAYAGRAPFQLGKPIGAIVGPYQDRERAVQAISVMTNKAAQEAVRGFGQAPTNYAIETAIDKVAAAPGLDRDRSAAAQFHPQRGVSVSDPERHRYDSGDYHTVVDKVLAHVRLGRTGARA